MVLKGPVHSLSVYLTEGVTVLRHHNQPLDGRVHVLKS